MIERVEAAMVVYCGWFRDPHLLSVFLLDGIAGAVSCPECSGSGEWTFEPTDAENGPCVSCKGTGSILVSV